ncbi:hypothetical protein JTB14_011571 [Gonioctena quinquepunctata]|nr:hypothetical protein JTB14_011571 [Gonioctena quinquepunctata]
MWNLVNHKDKTNQNINEITSEAGNKITCKKEIAEEFNNYFTKVGENLARKISQPTNPPPARNKNPHTFYLIPVTVEEISEDRHSQEAWEKRQLSAGKGLDTLFMHRSDPTTIIQSDKCLREKWYWTFNSVVHTFPARAHSHYHSTPFQHSIHDPIMQSIRFPTSESVAWYFLLCLSVQTKEQYQNFEYKDMVWKKVAKELNVKAPKMEHRIGGDGVVKQVYDAEGKGEQEGLGNTESNGKSYQDEHKTEYNEKGKK